MKISYRAYLVLSFEYVHCPYCHLLLVVIAIGILTPDTSKVTMDHIEVVVEFCWGLHHISDIAFLKTGRIKKFHVLLLTIWCDLVRAAAYQSATTTVCIHFVRERHSRHIISKGLEDVRICVELHLVCKLIKDDFVSVSSTLVDTRGGRVGIPCNRCDLAVCFLELFKVGHRMIVRVNQDAGFCKVADVSYVCSIYWVLSLVFCEIVDAICVK